MKVSVASTNATGGQDATASFLISLDPAAPPILQVPVPLSPWLVLPLGFLLFASAAWWRRRHPNQGSLLACLLLVLVSGLVWAATVTLDGNVGDWSGISPVAGNARGSAPIDANIVAVFYQSDAANLYFRIDADVREERHQLLMKLGHRARDERHGTDRAHAGGDDELVVDEVERQGERLVLPRHRSSGEAARRDVQRDVPPVIEPRRLGQADLAHHLRAHVERVASVFPFGERQRRPDVIVRHKSPMGRRPL